MAGFTDLGAQLVQDLRYAWRSFAASPSFTIAAVLTIALGVGVNAGIFSVLNAVAFRGLPAAQPDELVAVNQVVQGVRRGQNNSAQFSTVEYEAYRDRSETLSGVLAYGRMWLATVGGEDPRQIVATPVSCNYFHVLQLPPALGGFAPEHCDRRGDAAVAVLAHDFWGNRFEGDPSILGRMIVVNGNAFQIVGVGPEGFAGIDIDQPSLFVPLEAQPLLRPDRDYYENDSIEWLNLVGRRNAGIAVSQVEAELEVVAGQLDAEQPGRTTTVTVAKATPLAAPEMRTGVLAASAIVMTAFALVLLVACTNVATLMLARADTRARETAIRLSLGATRARLVKQWVTESLFIAIVGGLLGAVLAVWAFQGLLAAALTALPSGMGALFRIAPEPDLRVFAFAVAISTLAGLGFGVAPALTATRPALRTAIQQDAPGAGHRARRLQGTLVGVQIAFSMMLVVATALLLRGLHVAQTVDPAFDHDELLVVSVDMRGFGYEGREAAPLQRQAIDDILALPGVEGVAQALLTPLEPRARRSSYRVPGETEDRTVITNNVSANYFAVTGIPIVRGRAFTEAELQVSAPSVVILTESTARAFWPDQEPIGKSLLNWTFDPQTRELIEGSLEVVGIARDVEVATIAETDTRYVYLPATLPAQHEMQLVIRTRLPAESLREGISTVFGRLDSRLPVIVRPLADNFEFWTALSRLAASLSFGLGALALVLASVGVFGVMSMIVARRTREIGVRLALGAGKADVLRLMLRKSMRPVAIGALCGTLACFGAARLLSSLLFGVGPLDPYALTGAAVAVLGAAFLASAIPARRVMSVDPMTTLRHE